MQTSFPRCCSHKGVVFLAGTTAYSSLIKSALPTADRDVTDSLCRVDFKLCTSQVWHSSLSWVCCVSVRHGSLCNDCCLCYTKALLLYSYAIAVSPELIASSATLFIRTHQAIIRTLPVQQRLSERIGRQSPRAAELPVCRGRVLAHEDTGLGHRFLSAMNKGPGHSFLQGISWG